MRVLDISAPCIASEAGYYDTRGLAYGLAVSTNAAYVADMTNFGIYDVSAAIGWNGPLNRPQNLVVRYVPQGMRFQLNWNRVTADTLGFPVDVARYVVYRTTVAGTVGDSLGIPVPPDTTFFIDSVSFSQGSKFFYQVRAVTE